MQYDPLHCVSIILPLHHSFSPEEQGHVVLTSQMQQNRVVCIVLITVSIKKKKKNHGSTHKAQPRPSETHLV